MLSRGRPAERTCRSARANSVGPQQRVPRPGRRQDAVGQRPAASRGAARRQRDGAWLPLQLQGLGAPSSPWSVSISSLGVQITGGSQPASRHARSIRTRIAALETCLKFHATACRPGPRRRYTRFGRVTPIRTIGRPHPDAGAAGVALRILPEDSLGAPRCRSIPAPSIRCRPAAVSTMSVNGIATHSATARTRSTCAASRIGRRVLREAPPLSTPACYQRLTASSATALADRPDRSAEGRPSHWCRRTDQSAPTSPA